MQSGVVGIDTVIYLRLYGQMRAVANVERSRVWWGGCSHAVAGAAAGRSAKSVGEGRLSRFDGVVVSLGACPVVWVR